MLPYLPKGTQLKLFKYALSRVEFLDHSTYDVEKDFNLSIGMNSVMEMKNVGLNVQKITGMLGLPPGLTIEHASISVLRIRIPTDFYKSPVGIEVEGVNILTMLESTTTNPNTSSPGHDRHTTHLYSSSLTSSIASSVASDVEASIDYHLPTADSLTMSFLQQMPAEAQEVKSAIENRKNLLEDASSDEDSSDDELGMGAQISFWNFVPNFFRQLVDRIEVRINTVTIKLEVPASVPLPDMLGDYTTFPSEINENGMTIEIGMSALEVDGVTTKGSTQAGPELTESRPYTASDKIGKRMIRLVNLSVTLMAHPDNFVGESPSPSQHDSESVADLNSNKSDSTILPFEDLETSAHPSRSHSVLEWSFSTLHSRSTTQTEKSPPETLVQPVLKQHVDRTNIPVPVEARTHSTALSGRSSSSSNSDDYNDQMLSQSIYFQQDHRDDDDDDPFSDSHHVQDHVMDDSISGLGSLTHSMLSEADREANLDESDHNSLSHIRPRIMQDPRLDLRDSDFLVEETRQQHRISQPAPTTEFHFGFEEPERQQPESTNQDEIRQNTTYYDEDDDDYSDPDQHYLSQVISRSPSPTQVADDEEDDETEAQSYLPFLASTSSSIQGPSNASSQHPPQHQGPRNFTSYSQEPHFIHHTELMQHNEEEHASSDEGSVYQSYPGSNADEGGAEQTMAVLSNENLPTSPSPIHNASTKLDLDVASPTHDVPIAPDLIVASPIHEALMTPDLVVTSPAHNVSTTLDPAMASSTHIISTTPDLALASDALEYKDALNAPQEDDLVTSMPGSFHNSPSQSQVISSESLLIDLTPSLSPEMVYPEEPNSPPAVVVPPTLRMEHTAVSEPTSPESEAPEDEFPESSDPLAQSMMFSHHEAESLYMSAIGGISPVQSKHIVPPTPAPASPVIPAPVEREDQITRRVERKVLVKLNYLEVMLPGLHQEKNTNPAPTEEQVLAESQAGLSDSAYPQIPGAFSTYASRSSSRTSSSSSKKRPEIAFVIPEKDEKKAPPPDDKASAKQDRVTKVIFGEGSCIVDIPVSKVLIKLGKMALSVFASMKTFGGEDIRERPKAVKAESEEVAADLLIVKLDLRLVEKLAGEVQTFGIKGGDKAETPNTTEELFVVDRDDTDGETLLQLKLEDSKISYRRGGSRNAESDISTLQAWIGKFAITDGQKELLGFIPPAPVPLDTRRLSRSRKPKHPAPPIYDFEFTVSENVKQRLISIKSQVLKIYVPSKRLEEICEHFGGLGSVLSLAGSSTMPSPTIAKKPKSVQWEQTIPQEAGREMTLDAQIGGLVIELFVSENIGGVGISTSPLFIHMSPMQGISIDVHQLAAFGPQLPTGAADTPASTVISVNDIRVEFDSHPSPTDLEKLLRQVTPSMDRYDEHDDLMIDILFRQRKQGSVLRVLVGRVDGTVDSIEDLHHFSSVGDELARMATVTKYIPQDDRPGLLSVVDLRQVDISVNAGPSMGKFRLGIHDVEVCHVGSPNLIALAIRSVSASRNQEEELIGAALLREKYTSGPENTSRPMVRMRMIGDTPEPVIQVKMWNLKLEYDVNTLMSLLDSPKDASPEEVSGELVASIATITERHLPDVKRKPGSPTNKPSPSTSKPLLIDIVLSETAIGLNPTKSVSKAVLIVADARLSVALPSSTPLAVNLDVKRAYLLLIDDKTKLLPELMKRSDQKRRHGTPPNELLGFTSQGYVPIITIKSAKIDFKLIEEKDNDIPSASVEIRDVFTLLESCADSTKTLISVLSGLKPPGPECEEIKYKTEIMTMDLLASLDENAFGPRPKGKERTNPSSSEIPGGEADLVDDDVPFNAQFIDSYYPAHSQEGEKAMLASFHEQVNVIDNDPLDFNDDHFGFVLPSSMKEKKKEKIPDPRKSPLKVKIRNIQFIWNLHDGYDWQNTRDALSKAVKKVEGRAKDRLRRQHMDRSINFDESESDEEAETYDVLFNSIYITLPQNKDAHQLGREIAAQMKGGRAQDDTISESGSFAPTTVTMDSQATTTQRRQSSLVPSSSNFKRSLRNKLQIELKGVDVDFTMYAPDDNPIISEVDLKVNEFEINDNVPTSTWKKFVTYMREAGARETDVAMAHILVNTIKPVPDLAATELSLKVSILPLRLHVDQDSLDFLTRFFEFKDDSAVAPTQKVEEPFIQRFEIDTVRVKLDFKPKRVDYAGIRSGRTTEFMNFFVLEESEMEMRHTVLRGISGFERIGKELNDVWMPDIKKNQLPGVLAGVAPVRSLVNIGSGVRDLVRVPIMEYKKDGRIVRSIQKGAFAFAKTTTSEMVRFGAKVAIGTQTMLEKTEGLLGGETSTAGQRHYAPRRTGDDDGPGSVYSPYAEQPMGVYRGLLEARAGITRNIGEAREAIARIPADAAEGGSAQSAAGAVLRAAPTAIIRPMIGVAEAVHKTLHGIDNTLDKQKRDRIKDKYKKH